MNLWRILDIAGDVVAILLLVATVLSFIFKEWIKNRFSKAVQSELDAKRHALNTELESHKGAILRELEQFRADVDIKRSIALKVAEARIQALQTLSGDLARFSNEALSMACMTAEQRRRNFSEYSTSLAAIRKSAETATLYIPMQLARDISAFNSDAVALVGNVSDRDIALATDDPAVMQLIQQSAAVANALRDHLYAGPLLTHPDEQGDAPATTRGSG
jgi:hypothetical protein